MDYFYAPAGPIVAEADNLRRRIILGPEQIDYCERAMMQWSPAFRQAGQHFQVHLNVRAFIVSYLLTVFPASAFDLPALKFQPRRH
jgi:hypothetical protein